MMRKLFKLLFNPEQKYTFLEAPMSQPYHLGENYWPRGFSSMQSVATGTCRTAALSSLCEEVCKIRKQTQSPCDTPGQWIGTDPRCLHPVVESLSSKGTRHSLIALFVGCLFCLDEKFVIFRVWPNKQNHDYSITYKAAFLCSSTIFSLFFSWKIYSLPLSSLHFPQMYSLCSGTHAMARDVIMKTQIILWTQKLGGLAYKHAQ